MAGSILDNTRRCTYKGVPFNARKISATGGRSRVNYLYLNSGRRVTKDLGELPPEFVIDCFTHSIDPDEYEAKRDALRSALNSPLDGTFTHWSAGDFHCGHGKYTWSESISEAGVCNFSVTLSRVDKEGINPITPTGELFSKSQIKGMALSTNRALQAASADAFVGSTTLNRECTKSLFENVGGSLKGAFGGIGDTLANANAYADKAIDIKEQASYYANNPLAGFAAIADGILGIDGLTSDIYAKFRTVQALFNWGDADSDYSTSETSAARLPEEPDTPEDSERVRNADVMSTFMQSAAMAEAFAQAGASDPVTTEEIDESIAILDAQFAKVSELLTADINAEKYNYGSPAPEYTDAYNSMVELRRATSSYLRSKRANAAYIKTINVQPQPADVLAYKLYGNSERFVEIMELNKLNDNAVVSGDVMVLSK